MINVHTTNNEKIQTNDIIQDIIIVRQIQLIGLSLYKTLTNILPPYQLNSTND
jgi:hypothetical protein